MSGARLAQFAKEQIAIVLLPLTPHQKMRRGSFLVARSFVAKNTRFPVDRLDWWHMPMRKPSNISVNRGVCKRASPLADARYFNR